MAKSDYHYDPSPATSRNPISPVEAAQLIEDDGRALLKDPVRLRHFLNRVASTIDAYRGQIAQLNRDVQAMRIGRESAGRSSNLSPIENAKFAPPEELANIVDLVTRERFQLANKAFADAGELRTTVVRDYNRLKFAASGVLDDESLPPATRDRFRALLETPAPADLREQANRATVSIDQADEALDRDADESRVEEEAAPDNAADPNAESDNLTALFD
jgi:outer membrane murein-binding lipoprotein Lpp